LSFRSLEGEAWAAAFIFLALVAKSFLFPKHTVCKRAKVDQQTSTQVNISKSKRMEDTNIRLKSHWGELLAYESGGVKYHF